MAGAAVGVGVAAILAGGVPGVGVLAGAGLAWTALNYSTLPGQILAVWEARYRAFIYDRFDKFSKGMGDWAPLAKSTERRRRRGKGEGNNAILRDTGTLLASINPNITNLNAGGWQDSFIGLGANWEVEVGFGGPSRHPNSDATIADIASFHQKGGPHLPQRKIIVPPPPEVVTQMRKDAQAILSWAIFKSLAGAGAWHVTKKSARAAGNMAMRIWRG